MLCLAVAVSRNFVHFFEIFFLTRFDRSHRAARVPELVRNVRGVGKSWGLVVAPEQPPNRLWAASCAKRFDHFCVKSVRQNFFVDPPVL